MADGKEVLSGSYYVLFCYSMVSIVLFLKEYVADRRKCVGAAEKAVWFSGGVFAVLYLILIAYNLVPGKEGILQSHMLEVCPTIADGKIGIKVCPLSMGDREDPARLVFTSKTGPAIATSLVDLGDRFRLIINDVECKKVEKPMPKLPVGSAFWTPQPDLATGAEAWILAGGAHHTAFSYDLTAEQMGDWAAAMGIEAVYIDKDTTIRNFKNELRWNEVAFRK